MTDHMNKADAAEAAHELGRALAAGTSGAGYVFKQMMEGYKHELEMQYEEETGEKYQPHGDRYAHEIMMQLLLISQWTNLEAREYGTEAVLWGADPEREAMFLKCDPAILTKR